MSDRVNFAKSAFTCAWEPNIYLNNLSISQFQSEDDFVATKIFPVVSVPLPQAKYYTFSKADLARDNMRVKPPFGHVTPAVLSRTDASYDCRVEQLLLGIDRFESLAFERSASVNGAPDPRESKIRAAVEQAKLHLDAMFADKFFKTGVWANEYAGVTSTSPSTSQFTRFDVSGSDPVAFVNSCIMNIRKNGRRKPNRIALGVDTFIALMSNAAVLDRIKYAGSTLNPAVVSENMLAQLFGVETVVVLASSYNSAGYGETGNMDFICDSKGMLICYAPSAPAIDEPSAGYTFSWDMLGNGQVVCIKETEGEPASHTEFIEALIACDMKKTGDDLAIYCKDCCGA